MNDYNKPLKNNYWKTLQYIPRHYSAWPRGWEIHVRCEEVRQYGMWHENQGKPTNKDGYVINKKGEVVIKKVVIFDIPRECRGEARKDFKRNVAMDKRVAQASTSESDYRDLWKRIDKHDWEFIIKNDLKGRSLRDWAFNTRTADEYYRLLRYN